MVVEQVSFQMSWQFLIASASNHLDLELAKGH